MEKVKKPGLWRASSPFRRHPGEGRDLVAKSLKDPGLRRGDEKRGDALHIKTVGFLIDCPALTALNADILKI